MGVSEYLHRCGRLKFLRAHQVRCPLSAEYPCLRQARVHVKRITLVCTLIAKFLGAFSSPALCGDSTTQAWNIHVQETVVTQWHYAFHSSYSGLNSLLSAYEFRTSVTGTLFIGLRVWGGATLIANPEISGGEGLSGTTGIAGFPNGEIFRVGSPKPTPTVARLYLQQVIGLGEGEEDLSDAPNQLEGLVPIHRLTLSAGKFSLPDFFDVNTYSHDPRTQFMNWAFMANGAWDYAADTRGYTWGIVGEYRDRQMAARTAVTLVPKEANGLEMDTRIKDAFSLNVEVERRYLLCGYDGAARLLFYRNLAKMGNYRQATFDPQFHTDITQTRIYSRTKFGIGLNIEQRISESCGLFARIGWNDGKNETWAFTEIDRTVSVGGSWEGGPLGRSGDSFGGAILINGISKDHRDYLASGGYGFIIGDGQLKYNPEMILEVLYCARVTQLISVSGDYQFVANPAYNAARGPIHIFAVRVHTEM